MSEITLVGDHLRHEITTLDMYSDMTPMVKIDPAIDLTQFHTMVVRPTSLKNFVTAMFLADGIRAQGGWIEHLILPYVPGARQDRSNREGDVLFTAKSVARLINYTTFLKVSILDPHSPVITGLIRNVEVFPLSEVFDEFWKGWTGVIAPDKGAKDRAEQVANALGLEVTYASKTRDPATGRLSGFAVDLPPGGHYLVVDDICDGGGTFVGLGKEIQKTGSYASLYVTHGLFARGTDELKHYYQHIYTTDSLEKTHGVYTIPVVERMINHDYA